MQNNDKTENEDLDRYQIYSRPEIAGVLRSIQGERQPMMLSIRGGAHCGITTVLQVDAQGDTIVIDPTSDAVLNTNVLEASPISMEAVLDGITIQFETERVEECLFDGREALVLPLPAVLTRLQRREYYRIRTPRINALHCTVGLHENGKKTVAAFPLENISGGGVALIDAQQKLDTTFGRTYDDCEIVLPDHTFLVVGLEIRNCHDSSQNEQGVRRIGCQFIDLPRPMLTAVQRYITALEREQCGKGLSLMQFL